MSIAAINSAGYFLTENIDLLYIGVNNSLKQICIIERKADDLPHYMDSAMHFNWFIGVI